MKELLLSARALSIGRNGKAVAEGLDFSIHQGDYLCIVGANGSGKSTLLKTLLGLNPPVSGAVECAETLRPGTIGYLPQQREVRRDFPASVREVVRSGFASRSLWIPFYGSKERRIARDAMEKMGIVSLSRKCYRELSGGQQQRVLLARALCAAQKILFLDEPVAGLDPVAASDMYAMLRKLNRDEGVAVAMVSHDLSTALGEASHILCLGGSDSRCDATGHSHGTGSAWFGTASDFPRAEGHDGLGGHHHA